MKVSKSQRWVWTLVFLSFFLALLFVVWPLLAQAQTQERLCVLQSTNTNLAVTAFDIASACGIASPQVRVRVKIFVQSGQVQVGAQEGSFVCLNQITGGQSFECELDVFDGVLDTYSVTLPGLWPSFYVLHILAEPLVSGSTGGSSPTPDDTAFDILLSSGDTMRVFRHYSHGEIAIAGLALAQLLLLVLAILLFFTYQRRSRKPADNLTVDVELPPKRQKFPPPRSWSRRP